MPFLKKALHFSSLNNSENKWAILLGVVVLLPFISVSILGIYNYKTIESSHDIERYEKSKIEINLFQHQFKTQLSQLEQQINEKVLLAFANNGSDGIRSLTSNDSLFSLIVPFSSDGVAQINHEETISVVEKTILNDTKAEMLWAYNFLNDQSANNVWSPVRSLIGNAYLYCWLKKNHNGFCVLLPAKEVYEKLWRSELLQKANKNIHIKDSFMANIGTNHLDQKRSSTSININGIRLNISASPSLNANNSISSLWLILAMTLPLLGLTIAIAWMIFLSHRKQTETATKLLHGTQEIAHELRTPLSNVSLYMGLILQKNTTAEQLEYGEVITNEMQRITRIIDNATELMRGNESKQYEYGNPSDLIDKLRNQYQLSLANSGCNLTSECKDIGNCSYPKYAVEHVVLNLLSNAKKYAPGQKVKLGVYCENNILKVWVENFNDNTLDTATDKDHLVQASGLGLGLMSCERITKSLNGRFYCEINKNGRCYTAHFPLKEEKLNA